MTEIEKKQKQGKTDELILPKSHGLSELEIDFVTTSAIKSMQYKYSLILLPIFWLGSFLIAIFWANYFLILEFSPLLQIILIPVAIFASYFIILIAVIIVGKSILIILNLIHKPREGIFIAEKSNKDYEFWCLRIQLKKFVIWWFDNSPIPWLDILGFKYFGLKVDFSSHMFDAWVDPEFIEFKHKVTVGQGATIMSSMIVGKYLIIKKVIFENYTVIGGVSNIAPGTKVGKETIIGAFSTTNYNQELEPGWVYFGIPASKLRPNRYSEIRTGMVYKKDVDEETKYLVEEKINIEEEEEIN
ncbi:MAG: hypothetical protein ACQERB_06380 [Promethearchaeati archaeon]